MNCFMAQTLIQESDGDEEPTEPVHDERWGRALLREDVLVDERGRERNDPDRDQKQEVQIQKASVDAPASSSRVW